MKNLLINTLFVLSMFIPFDAIAQTCECTDCPIPIIDNTITTSFLEITGLTNSILNSGGQGVCSIDIQFDHSWLTEVSITLIAPNGSSVVLVPNIGFGATTNCTWDIDFIPCADAPSPDPGFPAIFNPEGYFNSNYTGTYYPGSGCFEDLTGDANGIWQLEIEDYFVANIGEVTSWSITFCDGSGVGCGGCEADAGTNSLWAEFVCLNESDLTAAAIVTEQAPLPDYGFTFIISNNVLGTGTEVLAYSDNADFTGIDTGLYLVCGLSYLITDEPLLPTPDGVLTNADIQDDIDNMLYCADISSSCYPVIVTQIPEVPEFTIPDTLCDGDFGEFLWTNGDPLNDPYYTSNVTFQTDNVTWIELPTHASFTSSNPEIDSIQVCVTVNSFCGSVSTCKHTVIIGVHFLEILGETETCYGNTYEYSISDLGGLVSYTWWINPDTEDSYIIGSDSDPTVNVGFPDIPDQFSGEICITYEDFCGNVVSKCLEITPNDLYIEEDLTPATFCGLSGDFDIVASGSGTGFWVQSSGPGTSVFVNENELNTTVTVSEPGMYSFMFTTNCGDIYTVDIEFFETLGNPTIEGVFLACEGELLTFSVVDLDPNIILEWHVIGSGSIQGAADQNPIDVLLDDPASDVITSICLDYEDPCGAISTICEVIDFIDEDLEYLSDQSFCSLEFLLDVQVNGMNGTGQWSIVSGPGTAIFGSESNSTTTVTVDAYGDYTFVFTGDICGSDIEVPIAIYDDIAIENLVIDCFGEDFYVSFDIVGGLAPYTVDGIEITDNSFLSGLIFGENYSFTVGNNSICGDLEVTGTANCDCISEAGGIAPQEFLVSCDSENISISLNGDAVLESNDIGMFILYSDVADPLGSIEYEYVNGDIFFTPPLQYDIVYYVAYVVGDELSGFIDYADPCLDLATGASIQFVEPIDLTEIEITEVSGCEFTLQLTAIQSSVDVGEWTVISSPADATVMFDSPSELSTIATFSDQGTYTIEYSIDIEDCSYSIDTIIEVSESSGISVVNISYICDGTSENYQVSFDISGGIEPYIVNGDILSGVDFTSQNISSGEMETFEIVDSNGCAPFIFISDFTCVDDCISYAELELGDLVEICGDETFTISESGNSVLEGDDIGVFILHTNSGNVLGTILDQNTTGQFTYMPSLEFEVVYFISFVVGNEVAGNIDLLDECLSVTPGQSIVFHERPFATLDFEAVACSFSFDLNSEIVVGDSSNWSTIISPVGSTIDYTNITASNVSITVDRVGEYSFTYYLSNGTCSRLDTVSIEVQEQSSVEVMDDFSTCDLMFDIYAISTGSPQSWDVIGGPNYSIDDIASDSTIITFDNAGIYQIVRNSGSGICSASDTFAVEIFDESTFTITDILCNENNETYTVSYTLEGSSYPYNINGQIINIGESAVLSADSEETLIIYVEDANMCEIFTDTLVYSCDCQSDPGVMDSNLIEACEDETIVVTPSQGGVVIEFDSLVYVLHTSSGLMITNILSVSDIGEFSFDPLLMSFNTVYYISAVVFSGSTFDIDVLDDVCTKISIGTPVIWINNNQIVLPGTLTFCEFDEIEISLTYLGFVPATVRLTDESGNEYNLVINQEGENNFTLDLAESSIMVVDLIISNSCGTDVVGGLEINIVELPFVGFESDVTICNSSAYGSTVPLNELISASNTEGVWYDFNDNIVSGIIDFDGISEGDYIYRFVTTGNEPCDEVSYSVHIFVEDCICPMDIFLSFDGLCQGEYDLELDDYLKPEFIGLGTWSILTLEGTHAIPLIGSELFIDDIIIGRFQLIYEFDELPQNCLHEYTFEFEIQGNLSSGIGPLMPIEICKDDIFEIILFDYLSEYDEGGEWTSQNGLPINILTGLVDMTTVDGGLYTFDYTIPANEYCPPAITEVLILIHDPLELFLSFLDPICFGQNDGSVEVTDSNGTAVQFDLFNNSQEIISDPDSLFAGLYELTTVDENGCVIVENFTLLDPLALFLDLGEDRIVEEGEITTITPVLNLEGENISLYQWFINQANLDVPTFDTLLISPEGETNVQLIITDDDGCIVADDLQLTVINNTAPPILANVFNPISTTFGVEPFDEIESVNRFSIFDRWGSLIFEETNFNPADRTKQWNGTFKGTIVSNGVYVYIIEYTTIEGKRISIYGDVAVIR